ncbi:UTP--glucose-1-phosphate uridylyltransferase [Patescibacteria group bacterium]|nr:UTP--glucose-1-phosphate uridylyltransferase [Patescibacteria group bacterium]MBU1613451.1 UTP--glucose-1-phosphate uridylyltransferase [Patescibacteria group bacterium]
MKKIRKAIIPVGGDGKRFLPCTKAVPKEMLPVGNKPVVLHVVEEAVQSGIEEIIFIISPQKNAVVNFFSPNEMYERYLLDLGKDEEVERLRDISKMAQFTFVPSAPPYGNGGAIWPAKHLIGNEPFVVMWGDEFFLSKDGPRLKQCIDAFYEYEEPIISAVEIEDKTKRHLYGMAELQPHNGEKNIKKIVQIVEKPHPGTEPSSFATHGAYVLLPEIFDYFKQTKKGKDGELWLIDIINEMKEDTGLLACIIRDGIYLDCGNYPDYLNSQIAYSLFVNRHDKNIKKNFKKLIKQF